MREVRERMFLLNGFSACNCKGAETIRFSTGSRNVAFCVIEQQKLIQRYASEKSSVCENSNKF